MNYPEILRSNNLEPHQAFVDLNFFDQNAATMAKNVEGTNLTIRIATKSIRVPQLIRRALDSHKAYKGLMCYSAKEVLFLANNGFDDFMLAYPSFSKQDLEALKEVHLSGKKISLVVDSLTHLDILNKFFSGCEKPFAVLFEVDLSLRLGPLVIGVRRSPLRTKEQIVNLVNAIKNYKNLKFEGLMAYEAHVAGVGDQNPFKPVLSYLLKPLRKYCAKTIAKKRAELAKELKDFNILFNGGGTGSLSFNVAEQNSLTELTAGSGFYCSHLFDYYSNFKLKPAAFFSLQVVRSAEPNWYTCLGGGYVASGEPGWDRIPKTIGNEKLSDFEATGEVQTPIHSSEPLKIGQPVIFRHAKAGELMERFNEILLIENGKVMGSTKTYRGHGQCFV